jgi:hydrophobe/amphiphile efflux-3 (HAE3) family protein
MTRSTTTAWGRVGGLLAHHGRAVLAVVVVATALLAGGLPRLEFETSQASLIPPDSEVYQVNERYQDAFGGEPMLVLWNGPATELFAGSNLETLRALEDDLRATGRFRAVLGPYGAMAFAQDQMAEAGDLVPPEAAAVELERLATVGEQSLDNPEFVRFLLTDPDGAIRGALRDNFPNEDHALLVVRLQGNRSIADQGEDADLVREVVARHPLEGFEVLATGPPVLLKEINEYLRGGMATLGLLAVVAMIVLLSVVFRARWRLLSLGVVCLGLVSAFGLLGYLGIPLSMVTISGLPILLGLGVDFAVQTHNRFEEELGGGGDGETATAAVMARMAGPLTIAMVAAVAGFLALQLSAVPMIDDFAVMLSVGMVVLVVEAIVVTTGVLLWRERRSPSAAPSAAAVGGDRLGHLVARVTHLPTRWALGAAVVAVIVGAWGLVLGGTTPVQTDPEAWVGEDSASVEELVALRESTGYSSEIGFLIEADDVTSPEVSAWVTDYARSQLDTHPELVSSGSFAGIVRTLTVEPPTAEAIDRVLDVASDDIVTSFVSDDRRSANLIFPMAPMSLQAREDLMASMSADLDPPPGVVVTPSGLAVVGIELVNALEANRQLMTVTALGLVAAWLLVAYRRPLAALLPLVPVVAAVGGSALAVDLFGFELTPLTTVSGPLAIAITTEFSVLLVARYLEEREEGREPAAAAGNAVGRIGRAFLASGLSLLGGFLVLAFSPMPLLVDFGAVVALDVALALVSVLVLLPPLLEWADAHLVKAEPAPAVAEPTMVVPLAGR